MCTTEELCVENTPTVKVSNAINLVISGKCLLNIQKNNNKYKVNFNIINVANKIINVDQEKFNQKKYWK